MNNLPIHEPSNRIPIPCVNSILIFIKGNTAEHEFCSEFSGRSALKALMDAQLDGVLLTTAPFPSETAYSISPELRDRVSQAKRKLLDDKAIGVLMDKHNIPTDSQTRIGVLSVCRDYHARNAATVS